MVTRSLTDRSRANQRLVLTGLRLLALGLAMLLLVGCAVWQAPAAVNETPWRSRAVAEDLLGVRLSAAVLSAEDSRALFGVDVNATAVQPVWVEVENGGADTLWLLRAGMDPDYFSPLEVAWSFHSPLGAAANRSLDEHFDRLAFSNPIPPGATRAGIIFTNPHYRTRVLNVDLLGQGRMIPFTLFLPVPDSPRNGAGLQTVVRYSDAVEQDFERSDALRAALQQLPCCGGDARGALAGDPLNVVLVGQLDHVAAAMVRRGLRADRRPIDDTQRLFGRRPDVVGRVSGQGGMSPYWIRLWVAPFSYRGQPVFVAQAGRPVGGRLAMAEGRALAVHPAVDEVRNFLIQEFIYSGGLAKLGFVEPREATLPPVEPADASATTRYQTDGLRAVMFFDSRPLSMSDIEILDWVPALELREAEAVTRQVPGVP